MEKKSPVEYSESEESEDINSALVQQLCKKYKFPACLDSGSNPSTVTLPLDESEIDNPSDSGINIYNDSHINNESENDIEESTATNSNHIKKLHKKLELIHSDENTNARSTDDENIGNEFDGVRTSELEYLNTKRKSLKRQLDMMMLTDLGLPKSVVTFFSCFRCFVFTNQILALLNIFLEILILIGIYNVSFPWKVIIPDETVNQCLSVVYFIEIIFPFILSMYGIFAGAFDPRHLRTFSRMAVIHIIFFNFLKLCVSYVFYQRAFDDTMEKEMRKQILQYSANTHLDLETSWDHTQRYLGCCGINSYEDWKYNGTLRLPTSCCNANDTDAHDAHLDLKACVDHAKSRSGCRIMIQEHLVQVLSASVVINWLQLIFLTAAVLLAFRVWNIICSDEEYLGSPGWKQTRPKYLKQSQLSFFFVCIPDSCCQYECQNFDTKVHPVKSNDDDLSAQSD